MGVMHVRRMILIAAAACALIAICAAHALGAGDYRIAGTKWLTEGTGFVELDGTGGLVRVGLTDEGWFRFNGIRSGDEGVEWLTGYEFHAKVDATLAGIEVWEDSDVRTYRSEDCIPVPADLSPTVNDPFRFPPITIDGVTYTFMLTSENGGTLTASGRKDGFSFTADNVLWREGTRKPELPDAHSGCSAAAPIAGVCALVALASRRRRAAALMLASALALAPDASHAAARVPADVRSMPQKVSSYLPADPDALIMSGDLAAENERRFVEHLLAPWTNDDTQYLNATIAEFAAWQAGTARKKLWLPNGKRASAASLKKIADNARLDADAAPRRAIAVSPSDVRVLPTTVPHYTSAASALGQRGLLKQDVLQNSAVKPGEPLAVWSTSRDSKWCFVSTESCMGWVQASAVALVSDEFVRRVSEMPRAVAVRDDIKAKVGGRSVTIKLGAVLPTDGSRVYAPTRGKDGTAALAPVDAAKGSFERFPVPFTARNAARAGDALIGEPYGWGGANGTRDCSMMTRDYFATFGIWIPRNSADQARTGEVVPTSSIPVDEREAAIKRAAVPFATIVHIPGHIMLYIGEHKGRAAVLHNMWGVRLKAPKGRPARLPIGRALITSLRFAEEMRERADNALFIQNTDAIATPMYADDMIGQ